tara:strand:+ start:821 stop:1093 length:273 start_codon:yes stop_codon:yes gene_type:complete
MAINETGIYTKVIGVSTFTITPDMGYRAVSFVLESGTGQYKGSLPRGADASENIQLVIGQAVTITADGPDVVGTIIIEVLTGTVKFMAKQ